MLWELEQLERRRTEIEDEIRALNADTTLSAKKRQARFAELNREDTQKFMAAQALKSKIAQDPQLSKMLDQKITQQADRAREARNEREVAPETVTTTPETTRGKLRNYIKAWREKPTGRASGTEKVAGRQNESEWEPDE